MKLEHPLNLDNELSLIGRKVIENLRDLILKMKQLELTDTGQEIFMYTGEDEDSPYTKVKVTGVRIINDDNEECLKFTLQDMPDNFGEIEYDAKDLAPNELVSLYSQYYAHNISTIKKAI